MIYIIAIVLAGLAIHHTDDTPVPNLYQQPGQVLTITGDPMPVTLAGWQSDGSHVFQRFDPFKFADQHHVKN